MEEEEGSLEDLLRSCSWVEAAAEEGGRPWKVEVGGSCWVEAWRPAMAVEEEGQGREEEEGESRSEGEEQGDYRCPEKTQNELMEDFHQGDISKSAPQNFNKIYPFTYSLKLSPCWLV